MENEARKTEHGIRKTEYGERNTETEHGGGVRSFKDLRVWKEGHHLVLLVYQVSKAFPREEMFGLTAQTRRSAVSVTSNLSEGFGRQSFREKVQFYATARGSLTELQNQIEIAKDIGYISHADYSNLLHQSTTVHKMITGLLKSTKRHLVLP